MTVVAPSTVATGSVTRAHGVVSGALQMATRSGSHVKQMDLLGDTG